MWILRIVLALLLFLTWASLQAQLIDQEISQLSDALDRLKEEQQKLESQLIDKREEKIIQDLKALGLPSTDYIEHSAMILSYDEAHEQAKWVAHMILPQIEFGAAYRSNDFRVDPLVTSGTAIQEDYFLTDTLADGTVEYDGFGYDRGHLAPSADFRWSKDALSESYFYSNMSPQLAEFNREKWAELENFLRNYVVANKSSLYVLTAPILHDNLQKIDRAIHSISIPEKYIKAVYDAENKRAIGFIMENKKLQGALENYSYSLKEIEDIVGYSLFSNIPETQKTNIDKDSWFSEQDGDVKAIYQPSLPPGHFNSVLASSLVGENAIICGTVVSTKFSRKGNLWMNVDKQFPNQIFSLFIRKEDVVNFPGDIKTYYKGAAYCFEGKVENFNGVATIKLTDPQKIKPLKN